MKLDLDGDLKRALGDGWAETATIGGKPVSVVVDALDALLLQELGAGVVGPRVQLTAATVDVPTLTERTPVVYHGATHFAQQVLRIEDGHLTTFYLADS